MDDDDRTELVLRLAQVRQLTSGTEDKVTPERLATLAAELARQLSNVNEPS